MAWKTKIPYRLIDFSARTQLSENYVIGVKRISDSGGAGTWVRIDENDNIVEVEDNYFSNHPTYQFSEVTIEDNDFIEIPKFYIKSDGNTRFWISPEEKEGFKCHPAFMSNGNEIDSIYIGKYQGYMYENKMYSVGENIFLPLEDGETDREKIKPTVYITFEQARKACEAWNSVSETGAVQVTGFHMLNIHEVSACQWLALIEKATTNAAMEVPAGYGIGRLYGTGLHNVDDGDTSMVDNIAGEKTSGADFHGIIGLWGNIWEFIDGIKVNSSNKLLIWDNDGRKVWKQTDVNVPYKKTANEIWSPGVTCGYYKNRLLTAGYLYDTADLFLPDFTTLTPYYENGSFSDGIYGRIRSNFECKVAIGGGYDTGDFGGLYSYRFDIQQPATSENSEGVVSDYGDNASDIGTRLCFASVNLNI